VGGGPGPLPLRWGRTARAAAAAPFPPHRPPSGPPPSRILVTVPARAVGPSSTRRASCRRESSLSRALRPAAFASLRFAPGRPPTANFLGKIRHLPGGRGRIDQPPERALAFDEAAYGPDHPDQVTGSWTPGTSLADQTRRHVHPRRPGPGTSSDGAWRLTASLSGHPGPPAHEPLIAARSPLPHRSVR
jgi:hypothetical protein